MISTIQHPLGKTFAVLTKYYVGALSAKLAHLDLDRHFYLLHQIAASTEPLTQSQLGDIILQDKSAMVRIVDYLVERGYVKRIQNPSDRREYFIALTSKARAIVPEINEAFENLDQSALNFLSEKQLSCLHECLDTISKNLAELPSTQVKIEVKRKSRKEFK
jgi:DNA-binding MarR family transcriptional regulator